MPSILTVDDQPGVIEMLTELFKPAGFDVSIVLSGEDALNKYREENFDVVLADIAMEPMDGITLLMKLKAYDPNVVVIMMSGYTTKEVAMQALRNGAFDFQEKPFKFVELIKSVRRGEEERARRLSAPSDSAAVEQLETIKGKELAKKAKELEEKEKEIEQQKSILEESQSMLQEREEFLEMSENTLFEKGQRLQEIETGLEQMRDDLDERERNLGEGGG